VLNSRNPSVRLNLRLSNYGIGARAGLIEPGGSAKWTPVYKDTSMRTEIEKTVAEIEQVLTLLRRHL